ncbi:MAG: hypothetical protein ACI976_001871 [Aureispira sp.]|jgi:hypothetical protein
MKFLNPKKSDKVLQKTLAPIHSCQDAVDQFLAFFKSYPVKKVMAHEEEDMLLFQYGTYNWDHKGPQFEFNLTRQFEIPNQDEFLQLGLTLYYSPEKLQTVESFNAWSIDYGDLQSFKTMIETSEGFQSLLSMEIIKVKINLSGT